MSKGTMEDLQLMRARALSDRDDFWTEVANNLTWTKPWTTVYDGSKTPFDKWFVGGELNLCYQCVDRHVQEGFGDRTALIFDSPVTDTHQEYTFTQVLHQVSRLAGVLTSWGVEKGDRVLVYMPMIPEGVFSMLACARIGAMHVCVPSGLPAKDLALRLDHCRPKMVLAASYGFHPNGWLNYKAQLDAACQASKHPPQKAIIFQRELKEPVTLDPIRDADWTEAVSAATPVPCVPMEANEPAFMVYTSGSTAAPKGIVHAVGRYAVRLQMDIPFIFGHWDDPDDEVTFMASNFGWIAGHSLVVYGPLLHKNKTVIFEGDPLLMSDVHALYKLISSCKITRPILRPGILKLLKSMDPDGQIAAQYNFDRVKLMFIGGERSDSSTIEWASNIFQAPLWDGYGQSEASTFLTGIPDTRLNKTFPLGIFYGNITPGWDFLIMKSDNTIAKPKELGRILARLPLPPGGLLTIFENEDQFLKNYFSEYPGYFDTKDEGMMDEEGRLKLECRADDIMKVGQVYLAAQAVEDVVSVHSAIVQCVVVSFPDLVWKELPVLLYVQRDDCNKTRKEISEEFRELVQDTFGSSVKFGGAVPVQELPRTRTGKVHRPSCNLIIRGATVTGTGAVENPHVFEPILEAVKAAGFGKDVRLD